MDLGLRDKVGIVTGASGGIGSMIVRELAGEGCSLTLTGRNEERLAASAAEANRLGGRTHTVAADLRRAEAGRNVVEATLAEFGRLDFVVANAGSAQMGDFLDLTSDDWQEGFALKLFGHVQLVRAAWPALRNTKGSLVFIAGAAGRTPNAAGIITGCVNSSLLNLTKSLAARGVAEGVRVNAVNPGMTRTERFTARVQKLVNGKGMTAPEAEKYLVHESDIMRVGEPEEIAAVVTFLLGQRAGFIHGAVIDVDGGKTKTL